MNIYPAHFFTTTYPPHDPARAESIDGAGDDGDIQTNGGRASCARGMLSPQIAGTEDDSDFSDLIANILHLAHSREMDPAGIITSAMMNFHAEAASLTETPTA